ncbi:MAG: hypothetical protein ACTH3G_02125 [Citricoccus sp.]
MDISPRLRRALGMGLATGAFSTIPLWRIPRAPLVLWTGGVVATLTVGGVALAGDRAEREAEVQGEPLPPSSALKRVALPVGMGAVAGGVAAGAMWFTVVSDRWAEALVSRLGASRPRATYAVLAGVLTAVLEYTDSTEQKPSTPAGEKA